mgnify:CR=1 FL=1
MVTNKNWRCLSGQTFFGLTDNYMASVYEQIFVLMKHSNWSFIEAYNLPVGLRFWFFERIVKHFEDEKKAYENASRKTR